MPSPSPAQRSDTGPSSNDVVLALFIAHHKRVHAFVRSMTDAATADDITQETFLRLMTVPDLATREISSSYLIKIAHNLVKRRKRRAATLDKLIAREAQRSPRRGQQARTTDAPPPSRAASMARLPQHQHDAVRLIVCEGLSYRAAAAALHVNVTTVNNWKHRGLASLRNQAQHTPGRSAAG